MTLWEIQRAMEGKQTRLKTEFENNMRVSAMIAYRQADLIGLMVSKVLGGKNKVPTLSEAFPGVFPDAVAQPRQQDWRVMKARMEQYANAKKKWGEQRGNNNRGTPSIDHSQDRRSAEGNQQGKGAAEGHRRGD